MIDKRKKFYRTFGGYKTNDYVGAIVMGLFAGLILAITLFNATHTSPIAPQSIKSVVQEVRAYEVPCDYDPISYIRCSSQRAGLSDKDGSMLIRIARAESGCQINPTAQNKYSTARGSFQIIIGTWESNDCDGKRTDHKSNTDCAIKIYKLRGTQPWKTSAHQKSGNGWADENQCYKAFI